MLFTNVSGQPTNSIPKFTDYHETIGGKVASYVTKEYEVRDYFGEIVKTDSLPIYQNSHYTSFDTLGRIVLYEHRHKDSVLSAVSYKYDDLNMTITQTVYEQGIWNSQYIRVYDSEKFIVVKPHYDYLIQLLGGRRFIHATQLRFRNMIMAQKVI